MTQGKNTQTPLIVPVNVLAYCVGTEDAQTAVRKFSGAQTNFIDPSTSSTNAFLGANVTRSLDDAPLTPLDAGVHLHWSMPKALSQGSNTNQGLSFPAAPNRWLVTRLIIDGATVSASHWVVVSDQLNENPPQGQAAITLPVKASNGELNSRYVGQSHPLDQHQEHLYASSADQFIQQTGASLSAVTNGLPTFAAFYPGCASVFGFYDAMDGVADNSDVMYVVSGWYDSPKQDLLAQMNGQKEHGQAKAQKNAHERLGWKIASDSLPENDQDDPTISLFNGSTQAINWNAATRYVPENPDQSPVKAEMAVANTSAEAMAAFYKNKYKPDTELFEQMLVGLQYGLLDGFSTPTPNQFDRMLESLLEAQFATRDGGIRYQVQHKANDKQATSDPLPANISDALNTLNQTQHQADRSSEYLRSYRWELFADWYRIFKASDSSVQNTAFQQVLARLKDLQKLEQQQTTIQAAADKAKAHLTALLPDIFTLKEEAAERYFQAAEPTVMLKFCEEDGANTYTLASNRNRENSIDNSSESVSERLSCRTQSNVLTELTINDTRITAAKFSTAAQGIGDQIPYANVCAALVEEACLLNTSLLAALTRKDKSVIRSAEQSLLAGEQQPLITAISGDVPSPVAINWWDSNPWLPLMMSYSLEFQPLFETVSHNKMQNYPSDFFYENFKIDADNPAFVGYQPASTPVNPATANFAQHYSGSSILSDRAPLQFAKQLKDFISRYPDQTLSEIETDVNNGNILVQPLIGMFDAWLMRSQTLQLPISVQPDSQYAQITHAIAQAVGASESISPDFNGYFNPIRTGWFRLKLEMIDVFGEKRPVEMSESVFSASMTAHYNQKPVPNIGYLPPRLATDTRLFFSWVMGNARIPGQPAPTENSAPIRGWVMTDHLNLGLFMYDQNGLPLGEMFIGGQQSIQEKILWQPAPGNENMVYATLSDSMAAADPVFAAWANELYHAGTEHFKEIWKALDSGYGSVTSDRDPGVGYAWLVGRPIAVAEADLRLEVRGMAPVNQSFASISGDDYIETDNGTGAIEFPVAMGGFDQLNDGLIGFYLPGADHIKADFSTFYSPSVSGQGVQVAQQDTLALKPVPALCGEETPDLSAGQKRLVIFLEPHAPVHATTGILPTRQLELPQDLVANALANIELWFLAAPILRGQTMQLPTPKIDKFDVSFVEAFKDEQSVAYWEVDSQLQTPTGGAVWGYTPQTINEGWLRFNQQNIQFSLEDTKGKPLLVSGQANNNLSLEVTNAKENTLIFNLATGQQEQGSTLTIDFGQAVAQKDVANIQLSSTGWTFTLKTNAQKRFYWEATPTEEITLAPHKNMMITINQLVPALNVGKTALSFQYSSIAGTSDGVFLQSVTIQPKNS